MNEEDVTGRKDHRLIVLEQKNRWRLFKKICYGKLKSTPSEVLRDKISEVIANYPEVKLRVR